VPIVYALVVFTGRAKDAYWYTVYIYLVLSSAQCCFSIHTSLKNISGYTVKPVFSRALYFTNVASLAISQK